MHKLVKVVHSGEIKPGRKQLQEGADLDSKNTRNFLRSVEFPLVPQYFSHPVPVIVCDCGC